jgi:hypothetical protein
MEAEINRLLHDLHGMAHIVALAQLFFALVMLS